MKEGKPLKPLSEEELEQVHPKLNCLLNSYIFSFTKTKLKQVSVVFHQYGTGVRSGTIKPGVTKYEIKFVFCAQTTPDKTSGVRPQPIYRVTVLKLILISLLSKVIS